MFIESYKSAFNVLKRKPFKLWGLSLLSVLVCALAICFSWFFLPAGIAFSYVVQCGMSKVYIDGLHGKEVNSDQLFAGFKNFFRIAGGMAWASLWIIIWGLIPFAGIVFAVIKSYEYRFVPYILITRDDVSATQALRLSKELTNGKKGQMFLADLVLYASYFVLVFILGMLMVIPFIGSLFALIYFIVAIVFAAFAPIFVGLYSAAFYEMPKVVKMVYTVPQQQQYQQPPQPQSQQPQAQPQQPQQEQAPDQQNTQTPEQ